MKKVEVQIPDIAMPHANDSFYDSNAQNVLAAGVEQQL